MELEVQAQSKVLHLGCVARRLTAPLGERPERAKARWGDAALPRGRKGMWGPTFPTVCDFRGAVWLFLGLYKVGITLSCPLGSVTDMWHVSDKDCCSDVREEVRCGDFKH